LIGVGVLIGVEGVESELVIETDILTRILVCLEVLVERVVVILLSVEKLSPRSKWLG
jgi:hypothetical protein